MLISCFTEHSCEKLQQKFFFNLVTNTLLYLSNFFSLLNLGFLLIKTLKLSLRKGFNYSYRTSSWGFPVFDIDFERGRAFSEPMEKQGIILMEKYELGQLLGQGTFAKVYHGRNLKTGQSVAIKMIHKEKVMRVGMMDQIKREISVMKRIKHPNVVELYEVMASKTKIYFVMEYVKGGELFTKVAKGKLDEEVARKYFQQLIGAIDFCHSRGVYHRDLKPENLLVDEDGNLKVSDFGLSALSESRKKDGLLHTTCGTPAYVAPEVICRKGYDGAKADLWSCGVVLYVLLAGYLPFHHSNIMEMYRKIRRAEFKFPSWFSADVRKVLLRILDPKPNHRITLEKLMVHPWFMKGLKLVEYIEPEQEEIEIEVGDVQAAFATTTEDNNPEIKMENVTEMKTKDNPETRMVVH
ncbi:hypothetical protein MKW94_029140, partial [Papaver nudicaule]|nr:hypothetical protein [Papaver nudicaule]